MARQSDDVVQQLRARYLAAIVILLAELERRGMQGAEDWLDQLRLEEEDVRAILAYLPVVREGRRRR